MVGLILYNVFPSKRVENNLLKETSAESVMSSDLEHSDSKSEL